MSETSHEQPAPHMNNYEEPSNGRWTREEHLNFIKGLELHGKGWKKIAALIKTRTVVQIRTHAQKYFLKLQKARNETNGKVQSENKSKDVLKKKSKRPEIDTSANVLGRPQVMFQSKEDAESSLYNFLTPNYPIDFFADSCEFYAKGQTVDLLLRDAEGLDWAQDHARVEASSSKAKPSYQSLTPKYMEVTGHGHASLSSSHMDGVVVKSEFPFQCGGFTELSDDALHSLLEMDATCRHDDYDQWLRGSHSLAPNSMFHASPHQMVDYSEDDIGLYFQD